MYVHKTQGCSAADVKEVSKLLSLDNSEDSQRIILFIGNDKACQVVFIQNFGVMQLGSLPINVGREPEEIQV